MDSQLEEDFSNSPLIEEQQQGNLVRDKINRCNSHVISLTQMVSSQLFKQSSPSNPRKHNPMGMLASSPIPQISQHNSNTKPNNGSKTAALSKERHSNIFIEQRIGQRDTDSHGLITKHSSIITPFSFSTYDNLNIAHQSKGLIQLQEPSEPFVSKADLTFQEQSEKYHCKNLGENQESPQISEIADMLLHPPSQIALKDQPSSKIRNVIREQCILYFFGFYSKFAKINEDQQFEEHFSFNGNQYQTKRQKPNENKRNNPLKFELIHSIKTFGARSIKKSKL